MSSITQLLIYPFTSSDSRLLFNFSLTTRKYFILLYLHHDIGKTDIAFGYRNNLFYFFDWHCCLQNQLFMFWQ